MSNTSHEPTFSSVVSCQPSMWGDLMCSLLDYTDATHDYVLPQTKQLKIDNKSTAGTVNDRKPGTMAGIRLFSCLPLNPTPSQSTWAEYPVPQWSPWDCDGVLLIKCIHNNGDVMPCGIDVRILVATDTIKVQQRFAHSSGERQQSADC